ncbi:MAG: hypothetical protein ACK5N8_01590 [Alphaproteobacteria bacterium]
MKEFVNYVSESHTKKANWDNCLQDLKIKNTPYSEIKTIKTNWDDYESKKLYDSSNLSALVISKFVKEYAIKNNIDDIIESVGSIADFIKVEKKIVCDDGFIKAGILYELFLGIS